MFISVSNIPTKKSWIVGRMKYILLFTALWSAAVSQQWTTEFTTLEEPVFSTTSSDEFLEQVASLVSTASISEERLQAVPFVTHDLELVLNTRWPGSRVIVFGSLVYGFVMTDSDVDCTVLLPHRTDMSHALIEDALDTLKQHSTLFADLFHITWARVPVVTFKHTPTQFKVDLTINNFAGKQISNLLKHLLHLDKRIYSLLFVVKHWAKVRQLTSSRALPNYGLTLMVIFYLQQRNMMPSISSLQVNANPFFENEWNLGYCEMEYDIQNDVPLNLLLGDFFKYYVDFDFDRYIVCPYTGYPVEKRLFSDISKIPSEFGLYVYNVRANVSKPLSLAKAFVLQDMFIHNGNVAEHVDMAPNATFITEFQYALKKFRENNINFLEKILTTK